MFSTLGAALVIATLIRIGLADWHRRRIGNRDVAVVALLSLLCFCISPGADSSRLLLSGSAALMLTVPGLATGRVGGGDVKLLLALAPLWSAVELLTVFIHGVVLTAAVAFLSAPLQRATFDADGSAAQTLPRDLPLGTAMMFGALCWFFTPLVSHG